MALPTLDEMYKLFQKQEKDSIEANLARETEIRGMYDNLISTATDPESNPFFQAEKAKLSYAQMIGGGQAIAGKGGAIDRGLSYNTTNPLTGGADMRYQLGMSSLAGDMFNTGSALQQQKAGFIERINEPPPDYSQLFNMMLAEQSKPEPKRNTQLGDTARAGSGRSLFL